MLYLLLIYTNEDDAPEPGTPEQATMWAEYGAYSDSAERRGILVDGKALHPSTTATTIRVRNGETLTSDGPYAATAEQLGGIYVVDVSDLDEAIDAAAGIPGARHGAIEVRPIIGTVRVPA
ncbi:MAG: YciI family protein [Acidimicrobiia bacterium]|nr:YciI family protein [Acidimicrobiia bacterium]